MRRSRLTYAADNLDQQLRRAGLPVHTVRGCLTIEPRATALTIKQAEQLMRRHRARRQLRRGDAALLLDPWTDEDVALGHLLERARARLRTAGPISADDDPAVDADVLFSLGL